MLIYAALEDAIITRIKQAQDAGMLGYKFAHIDSYGGEFDSETFWTSFRRFPAVWVTVGGEDTQPVGRRDKQCKIKGAVMVGARSPRGERFARRGPPGVPGQPTQPGQSVGTYQMMDDVRRLLDGQRLGLEGSIQPLDIHGVKVLYNTKIGDDGLSILVAEFTTVTTWTKARDEPGSPAHPLVPGATLPPDLAQIGLAFLLDGSPALEHSVHAEITRPD
jgi:phage gp37-like protein